MATTSTAIGSRFVAGAEALGGLISTLQRLGYQVIGPSVRDGAITLDTLESSEDLPTGWTDEQEPGRYRLSRRESLRRFDYAAGPHSWKRFLHPPEAKLVQIDRDGQGFHVVDTGAGSNCQKLAFLGVRPCELAAIAIQDRVFLGSGYKDPIYGARRNGLFIAAAQCTRPSSSCFCTSMGTGPGAEGDYDVALTEIADGDQIFYVMEAGTEAGAEVLGGLRMEEASEGHIQEVEKALRNAASAIRRRLDTAGIRELLYNNFDHPHFEETASRCLSCGNCTLVCPTCFCSTVEDSSEVTGAYAERWRRWDSCFVQSFSYIHGGSVRMSVKSRYRQWVTHKLAAWIDQFGSSGCVGCGRCITWCPAGIDITAEVTALRGAQAATAEGVRLDERNQSR